jgi:hypothetical protein
MVSVNPSRVLLGALAGGVVWNIWSIIINPVVLRARYATAQADGTFLKEPRFPFFVGAWIVLLFILAYVVAWLYASVRATRGAGPKTAAVVGLFVGFAAGFPTNFATWSSGWEHFLQPW